MGTTVTISSCVPIILCALPAYTDLLVEIRSRELRDKVSEITDNPAEKYGNKYCTLDLLRSSCGTMRF